MTWNGIVSLVGPRPETRDYVALTLRQRKLLEVRPERHQSG